MTGPRWKRKEGSPITVITYQSRIVLKILQSGKVYRAHRNLTFDRAYSALVDILGLDCECPVFGTLKNRRKCTNGKVSSSVKLTLEIPDEKVKLTEYSVWADFINEIQYSMPNNYKRVSPDGQEAITQHRYTQIIHHLQKQKKPGQYRVPQAVFEEIRPEWLVKYEIPVADGIIERIVNRFRKK